MVVNFTYRCSILKTSCSTLTINLSKMLNYRVIENLRAKTGKVDIKNIVKLVLNACNLKCRYCQIEENLSQEDMGSCSKCIKFV